MKHLRCVELTACTLLTACGWSEDKLSVLGGKGNKVTVVLYIPGHPQCSTA
jgi:hypothetical protein